VLFKHELHGIGHIAQQMKAIRDLYGVGGSVPCPFRVGTCAIATNHCDAGMGLQPLTQGRGFAIWE
jgi:hypothetical protein